MSLSSRVLARMFRVDVPPWMEEPTRLGRLLKGVALVVICALVIYPFLIVLGTSLAPRQEIIDGGGFVLVPHHPTLEAYRVVLSGGVVARSAVVSIGITLVGTAASLVCTVMLAYGLSRPHTTGTRPILLLMLGTFLFAPGIIPSYLVVKQLGLLDSYAALVVPVLLNAFNVVVVRAFFQAIPDELIDAARIDGAGEVRILTRIVLPLSRAVLAVVALYYAVSYWNTFFNAILYLSDSSRWPLQVILRKYVIQGDSMTATALGVQTLPPSQSLQMAVLVIAIVPIAAVYPFLQKYFVRGVLTGAVKG
ncbi:carbohydrate ABC transporter permease [Actinocatenispora comari]|uniref:ABC transporter permease n=1 Tax=Actinocatenispora comari TaxID=2807577 RepID=A0A8J4AFZ8_9ACTN|nr:carbohydrate ABC transporter permease [Actinocatenispora comari]GIL28977.1 ABC transporter permease [Actinocatenispora comari]